jgi:hypothetical protein
MAETFRDLLGRADCFQRVVEHPAMTHAEGALGALFIPHVREVLRRVDLALGDECRELWWVKLAVLVHEVRPAELPALLESLGFC